VVTDGQAGLASTPETAPEGADGVVGQVEVGGNLSEGLFVKVATNDLLTGGERNGAGHGQSSVHYRRDTSSDFTHA
jgi:hypothetical protein